MREFAALCCCWSLLSLYKRSVGSAGDEIYEVDCRLSHMKVNIKYSRYSSPKQHVHEDRRYLVRCILIFSLFQASQVFRLFLAASFHPKLPFFKSVSVSIQEWGMRDNLNSLCQVRTHLHLREVNSYSFPQDRRP